MEVARHLTQAIGPRVSGSQGEAEAVEFIFQEFQKMGLPAEIQRFKYLGWKQEVGPFLSVLSPIQKEIGVAPMAYTGSTPQEGVEGRIRAHGTFYLFPRLMDLPKYTVVDDRGETVASVVVLPGSRSKPIPNPWFQILQDPTVLVGEEEFQPIQESLQARREVRVRLTTAGKYLQDFTSYNVIATRIGECEDTIIIGGHHDSIEGCPGANDNASGVEGIFRMAKRLLPGKGRHTIKFITWGGHEWGLFGSQYFVKDAKERGVLGQIKACLTLDVLGCGDFLWIWAGPLGFRGRIEKTLRNSSLLAKREIRFEDTLIGSDDWSFSGEDIPHAMLMDWPIDTLHLPSDVFENIDEGKLNFAVQVTQALIEDFDEKGISFKPGRKGGDSEQ